MIKVKEEKDTKLMVRDLSRGDTAIIRTVGGGNALVYVFSQDGSRRLSMVDLMESSSFWDDINNLTLEVVRVLKSGDILEVA